MYIPCTTFETELSCYSKIPDNTGKYIINPKDWEMEDINDKPEFTAPKYAFPQDMPCMVLINKVNSLVMLPNVALCSNNLLLDNFLAQ